MTKLLQEAIEEVKRWPKDRQNAAGQFLLALGSGGTGSHSLTEAQLQDVRESLSQAKRKEFASDASMARTWKRFGL